MNWEELGLIKIKINTIKKFYYISKMKLYMISILKSYIYI